MLFHRHHSLFPFVLAGLTLALIVFMFYAFTGTPVIIPTAVSEPTTISAQAYEQERTKIVSGFFENYAQQPDDLAKLVLSEAFLSDVLSLRVPADQKEEHLALVIELNTLMQSLRSRDEQAPTLFEQLSSRFYVQN